MVIDDLGHFKAIAAAEQLAANGAAVTAPMYMPPGADERRIDADLVVLGTPNRPDRTLADALDGKIEVTRAGDAHSPCFLQHVIRDGHLAGARV